MLRFFPVRMVKAFGQCNWNTILPCELFVQKDLFLCTHFVVFFLNTFEAKHCTKTSCCNHSGAVTITTVKHTPAAQFWPGITSTKKSVVSVSTNLRSMSFVFPTDFFFTRLAIDLLYRPRT